MEGTPEFATVIGKGTNIKGDMSFDSNAAIMGGFEGRLTAIGLVKIGHEATCKGEVRAARVVIDGRVEGNVHGSQRVNLSDTAHVVGDIVATSLVVAAGASMEGHYRIGPGEASKAAEPVTVRRAVDQTLNGVH